MGCAAGLRAPCTAALPGTTPCSGAASGQVSSPTTHTPHAHRSLTQQPVLEHGANIPSPAVRADHWAAPHGHEAGRSQTRDAGGWIVADPCTLAPRIVTRKWTAGTRTHAAGSPMAVCAAGRGAHPHRRHRHRHLGPHPKPQPRQELGMWRCQDRRQLHRNPRCRVAGNWPKHCHSARGLQLCARGQLSHQVGQLHRP